MGPQDIQNIRVIWRGKDLNVEVLRTSKVHELGDKLQKLTNVKSDTLRLLVPKSGNKNSWVVSPFSDEHSSLSLQEASILEGKPIRMMGAFDNEVKEVSQTSMTDLRILGFDEEERRLRQRSLNSPQASLKLPQGTYIFCDFRTLHLPGVELNPPPSEALRRMHMLACDPGIIAIMNKHRWRVGIMTEMAPVGYVGISPKCILGFNKNHGEEISLRLRTDDLKGFRKYESIKKTLLHELAHMVYSEHDANFFALDKQLNQEAVSLDWTKSRSHTLSGRSISDHYEEMLHREVTSLNSGQKLGGALNLLASARASSVTAAYIRFLNAPSEEPYPPSEGQSSDATVEPDPDDDELKGVPEKIIAEPDPDDTLMIENFEMPPLESSVDHGEPDPDDSLHKDNQMTFEPDPDDSEIPIKCDPINVQVVEAAKIAEPDPDDSILAQRKTAKKLVEPDPDDSTQVVSSSNDSAENGSVKAEPDPDDNMDGLQRIEEPAAAICSRIQRAIEMLRSEATLVEASSTLQTLVKIIRNVIEHPGEMKFRKLRKSNPQIQRNVVSYKAAMEVLTMIGFAEDVISDEVGRVEAYLVLKRNDPGLLWLAKSSLEASMA